MALIIFDEGANVLFVSGREIRLGRNGSALMRLICGRLGWYGGKCYGELSDEVIGLVLDEGAAGVSLGVLGERKDDFYSTVGWILRRSGLRVEDALAALLAMGIDEETITAAVRAASAKLGALRKVLALLEAQDKAQDEAAGERHSVHDGPHDAVQCRGR